MGRLSYRQADVMGADLRPLFGTGPFVSGVRRVLGLLVMTALTWACGSDSTCPSGAAGSPCIPTDDLGVAPDGPPSTRDHMIDDVSKAADQVDGSLDVETSEPDDSTRQFLREVPDGLRIPPDRVAVSSGGCGRESGLATEHERVARCAAQTGQHGSRGTPPLWIANHVQCDMVEWRHAA